MKKIIHRLIDFYISPLQWSPSLSLFSKHRIMHQNEHLFAAVDMIKKHEVNLNGDIADVGTFQGGTTVFFAKNFPGLKITGFEPNPVAFTLAKKYCEGYPTIHLLQIALDQEEGEQDFYVADNNVSSSLNPIHDNKQFKLSQKIKVNVKTLDSAMKEAATILLIKLDTQGRELRILSNGRDTLRKTKYILTEMNNHNLYEGGCQYYEVDAFLRGQNFELINITSGYNFAGMTEYDALYKNTTL